MSKLGLIAATIPAARTLPATAAHRPGCTTDTVAPRLLSLTLSSTVFAAFSSGPSVRNARSRGKSVTYRLSEAATTMFRVQRVLAGRRVHVRCMRPTRANRRSSRYERDRTLRGNFRHTGTVGSTDPGSAAASPAAPGDGGLLVSASSDSHNVQRSAPPLNEASARIAAGPDGRSGRVGRAHCCARPPSEPDVPVSEHPAQASR
jgi:hypothetical protein